MNTSLPEEVARRPGVLITGGTAGIGLASAKRFAQEGYNVCICGRNQDRLDSALEAIQVEDNSACTIVACRCDLSESGAAQLLAQAALERLGRVDVLVNNAAVAPLCPFAEVTDEVFEEAVQLNIRSVFYLTREIWKSMKAAEAGVIVNISSLAAVDPFPGFSVYGSSKAWIDLMTTALSGEGAEYGIRVYSVRPGAVETKMLRSLFPDFPAEECVSPEDIASKVWECVSQPESHPSGQHFAVTNQPS